MRSISARWQIYPWGIRIWTSRKKARPTIVLLVIQLQAVKGKQEGISKKTAMVSRLFIHAANVHQGGGRTLLDALLRAIPQERQAVLSLDERMPLPPDLGGNVEIRRCRPTMVQRLLVEKWLADSAKKTDTVLCFGNLPPLFRLQARTIVFVQNRYLIDNVRLDNFSLGVRLRLAVERLWLSGRIGNADELVVQTPTMKRLAERRTGGHVPVRILPFVAAPDGYARSAAVPKADQSKEFDFVYVATGEPHKNHRQLIAAWCLLAEEGLFPTLCVTLDNRRFAPLAEEVEMARRRHGVRIVNAGELSYSDVLALYGKAGALIFPSAFESFGMPLIEARQAGLPILASELDYVRDVIDPEQTFDPESPKSIARAVKRFWQQDAEELRLQDAGEFLRQIR